MASGRRHSRRSAVGGTRCAVVAELDDSGLRILSAIERKPGRFEFLGGSGMDTAAHRIDEANPDARIYGYSGGGQFLCARSESVVFPTDKTVTDGTNTGREVTSREVKLFARFMCYG